MGIHLFISQVRTNSAHVPYFSRRLKFSNHRFVSGICVVYTLRVNISVAAPKMKDDLGWSEYEKGLVLVSIDRFLVHTASLTFCVAFQSAFYWGYSLGQIPASWIIQRYGAKWIFGFRYRHFLVLHSFSLTELP
jgi:hypothetical protein